MNNLAIFLKSKRKRSGISLRDLASKTGLSPSYLCDAENDRRTFSPDALRLVCEQLGADYKQAVKCVLKDVERRFFEKYTETM